MTAGTPNTMASITIDAGQRRARRHGQDGTTLEDTAYTFTAADFGFSDPNDSPANTCWRSRSRRCRGAGTLTNNGVAVTAGQFVSAADIAPASWCSRRRPTPTAHATPASRSRSRTTAARPTAASTSIRRRTRSPSTSTGVNDAPAGDEQDGRDHRRHAVHASRAADFGFSDPNDSPANTLLAVKITTLPAAGSADQQRRRVTPASSSRSPTSRGGKLVFTPAANANGAGYASFTFQVQDDGGTANGGVDLDPTPNTITINVTAVNDAPAGANKTVTTLEDTAYTFTAADFGFSDPNDSPGQQLAGGQDHHAAGGRAR